MEAQGISLDRNRVAVPEHRASDRPWTEARSSFLDKAIDTEQMFSHRPLTKAQSPTFDRVLVIDLGLSPND